MTTKLEGELKRELVIGTTPYILSVTPERLVLALRGKRKGLEIRWEDLVSGEAALLTANIAPPPSTKPRVARGKKRNG